LPLLRTVKTEAATTLAAITAAFNERRVPTQRGARSDVSTVVNLLARSCISKALLSPLSEGPLIDRNNLSERDVCFREKTG
jgi:hypothetical protein